MDDRQSPLGDEPPRLVPSGRVPQWVLDEAAGRPLVGVTGRDWTIDVEPEPRRRRRGRGGRGLLVLLLVAAVVVGLVVLQRPRGGGDAQLPAPAGEQPLVAAAPSTLPTPGQGESAEPLGTPPVPPEGDGAYAFVQLQADRSTPVAYDPCRAIHVVLNSDGAPAGAEDLVIEALTRMTEATGLQFVFEGVTDEVPADGRQLFQPDRYGDRWAPVLIGWRTPEQQPTLAGEVAGIGGSAAALPAGGSAVFVTGSVALDGPEFAELLATEESAPLARAILLHELGHVVGLQHVFDRQQLMYPTSDGSVLDFANGDLTGLAQLGAGVCAPEL